MESVSVALLSMASVVLGAGVGHALREGPPGERPDQESRELLKLLTRLISMLVALVLGLLVGSTKAAHDAANDALLRTGAKFVMLDHQLRLYGDEASPLRDRLRETLEAAIQRDWHRDRLGDVGDLAMVEALEDLHDRVLGLAPGDDGRRGAIRTEALRLSNELLQSRWLLVEQSGPSLPTVFLAGLISWLAVLFAGFGLLTPRSPLAIVALLVCAASISTAVFLILELNHPFEGLVRVSSAPLEQALSLMGRPSS
jgi:hypothetical protein